MGTAPGVSSMGRWDALSLCLCLPPSLSLPLSVCLCVRFPLSWLKPFLEGI